MRELIVEGLRKTVLERRRASPFRLRKASFRGNGLQSGAAGASWEQLRELAYEGRGG